MTMNVGAGPQASRDTVLVTPAARETTIEELQRAAGDGRLPLSDFSERVGRALAAETQDQLTAATAGLDLAPIVGQARTVSSIRAIFGSRRQIGRWRLPGELRIRAFIGDIYIDLRDVVVDDEVVEISAVTLVGNLCVDVPAGVDVELSGFDVLGDRELRLAPVPRRPGTPLIRVRAYGVLGDVNVRTPKEGQQPPSWWDWFRLSRW
ncbi:MAG: DUF1707 SHOCT-like domain-containing protein [Streptosporangiaceae bacterium]